MIEIAKALKIETRECHLGRFDLLGADEVFITGSGAKVVPIATLDGQQTGGLERPVMTRLVEAFEQYTLEHGTAF
jgi:branched-chain amino acid aminotransferase